jgi:hypothetical protein
MQDPKSGEAHTERVLPGAADRQGAPRDVERKARPKMTGPRHKENYMVGNGKGEGVHLPILVDGYPLKCGDEGG